MSDTAEAFVKHLAGLAERDPGALAALRRSLSFDPGTYPPAYPSVERFVGDDAQTAWRRALYLAAGLFALNPEHRAGIPFAQAFGRLLQARNSQSIEQRFVTMLDADEDQLPHRLRQAVSLLRADGHGFDYGMLVDDLARWMRPDRPVQQKWARDFYQVTTCDTAQPPL